MAVDVRAIPARWWLAADAAAGSLLAAAMIRSVHVTADRATGPAGFGVLLAGLLGAAVATRRLAPAPIFLLAAAATGLLGQGLLGQAQIRAQAAADRAERTRIEERLRVARELHDVIAHTMSVITVQAGVGAYVAARQPAAAARALATIEDTGRAAMDELRRILTVLRADGYGRTCRPLRWSVRRPAWPAGIRSHRHPAAAQPRDDPGPDVTIRVAIVDDQELVRAGFSLLVDSDDDMTVVAAAAGDGVAATRIARQHQPDVILMDMRMAGLGHSNQEI